MVRLMPVVRNSVFDREGESKSECLCEVYRSGVVETILGKTFLSVLRPASLDLFFPLAVQRATAFVIPFVIPKAIPSATLSESIDAS